MKALNKVNPALVSDSLYDASIGKLNRTPEKFTEGYKTRIIHLIDSVSRGYTKPYEAWEAIRMDYFPAFLEIRQSAYSHLIR